MTTHTTSPDHFTSVSPETFSDAVTRAMELDSRVNEFLSHGQSYYNYILFLSNDSSSGFAISPSGDLQSVFNISGESRGSMMVTLALQNGAKTLDCFDGYLPRFYARHGFTEVRREANWTAGGPDVVFMAYGS